MVSLHMDTMSDTAKKQNFTTLYTKIMTEGLAGFQTEQDFSEACRFTVKLCLSVADYLHANNVLQAYKQAIERTRDAFVYIDSILLYGRRLPRMYLRKPAMLEKTVARAMVRGEPLVVNQTLVTMMKFYVDLFKNYRKKFKADLIHFTDYFKAHPIPEYPAFNEGVEALHDFVIGTIVYEDITFDQDVTPPNIKSAEAGDEKPPPRPLKGCVYIKNPKVLVLGVMRINKDVARAIAKKFGFASDQLEFVDDYHKIKNYDIRKLQYTDRFCGIVFGPSPHSAKGISGDNSIMAHVENTEGYPFHVTANVSQTPKITKTSFSEALRDIKHHYDNTKID